MLEHHREDEDEAGCTSERRAVEYEADAYAERNLEDEIGESEFEEGGEGRVAGAYAWTEGIVAEDEVVG